MIKIKLLPVQTAQGLIPMLVIHQNLGLHVVKVPTMANDVFFYNTVTNTGLKIPNTDAATSEDAIKICDWIVANFPEFAQFDLDISSVSKDRIPEFKAALEAFRKAENLDDDDEDDY